MKLPLPEAAHRSPLAETSRQVDDVLRAVLARERREAELMDPLLLQLVDELDALIASGGKRIRPYLVCWGCRAAGGEVDERMLLAAAALELIHAFALIQDDMLDESGVRRGRPAAHIALGPRAALVLADLALVQADRMLADAGFDPARLGDAFAVLARLRSEAVVGEILDLGAQPGEGRSFDIAKRKTATYTVVGPVQLGMTLAGASSEVVRAVPRFAEPAGIAFQLRDDVLGALGDERATGKPAGDDLLAAKPTWQWSRACRLAGAPPPTLAERQAWLRDSGALADAEGMIAELHRTAIRELGRAPVDPALRAELEDVLHGMVGRSR
jgi:geranylgeranyl diphosphate synthase, type I